MRIYLSFFIVLICLKLEAQVLDKSWRYIVHEKDSTWFASHEAREIADNVLLYQRNIGGWPKNIPIHKKLSEKEKEKLRSLKADTNDVTFDNGATTQEMLFLSKVYREIPDERYRKAFLLGLDYILKAQYENGGWPQFYPFRDGYYSHITYNDNSMINILKLLKEIKNKTDYYSIKLPDSSIKKVTKSFYKGIDCILKTQYKQNGILTAWCAQHDAETLKPAKARSYELPSLSGKESAQIVLLLMSMDTPSDAVKNSVVQAVKWFEKVKINGIEIKRKFENGRITDKKVVQDKNAPPVWARFMELEDNTPFFCDRDGIKKQTLAEIGKERTIGYAWYTREPQELLDKFPAWEGKFIKKVPSEKYDIVVSKDDSGDFNSIQEAINATKAFPYERISIFIKNGIYKEKVKVHEWNPNISLIGESMEKTIITYDDYFNKIGLGRNSTFFTYTLLVEANNVLLKNLTIENASGDVGQAVALSVSSDQVAIINCRLLGNQDTLYASGKGKQYYKNCYIKGTTDFIFGSSTAFFDTCQIHSKKDSYITAASTPEGSKFGFVFNNCKITADEGVDEVYLGRPWRVYAKTVFMNCDLGNHILPEGWHNWNKLEAEKTTFYAEYLNYGEGFKPESRVDWAHQLNDKQAESYNRKNILGNYNLISKAEWYEKF